MTQMSTDADGAESPQIAYDTTPSRSYTLLVPFAVGLLMIAIAVVFSILGTNIPAGISGAIAVFFIGLSLLGYVMFWLLGKIGT